MVRSNSSSPCDQESRWKRRNIGEGIGAHRRQKIVGRLIAHRGLFSCVLITRHAGNDLAQTASVMRSPLLSRACCAQI